MDNLKYDFEYFENIYENVLKKGQTFSNDIGDEIKKELEKMCKQREEWLKKKQEEGNEATTENGTD